MPSNLGNPVLLLQDRCINESNRLNLRALVDILKSFNDFKKGASYNIGLGYARQLVAVTRLLDKAISCLETVEGTCPITQEDLKHAVDNIKMACCSSQAQPTPLTYANAVRS